MHSLFGIERRSLRARAAALAAVVAVSDDNRRQYLTMGSGIPTEKVVTIPNCVEPARMTRVAREDARRRLAIDDRFLFVSLARQCLQKNTYGLVAAFSEMERRFQTGAQLIIAGRSDDSGYTRQVLDLIKRTDLSERVFLRDHIRDPALLLAAADAFVLNSFFEGWSLASMQALAAGLPVVMSEVGGAREQIGGDIENGILVGNPAGDPLKVNWDVIGRLRFTKQINREEIVNAMYQISSEGQYWSGRRAAIAADTAARFDELTCLKMHAEVLLRFSGRKASDDDIGIAQA